MALKEDFREALSQRGIGADKMVRANAVFCGGTRHHTVFVTNHVPQETV